MVLLQCPSYCLSHNQESKPQSHDHDPPHLHSESSFSSSSSSSSSSISSQSSLPSVPSLTSSHSSLSSHHTLLSTLSPQSSSPIFSLTFLSKSLLAASSHSQIRSYPRHPSAVHGGALLATTSSAVKSMVVSGNTLFTAHQDNHIRVWKIRPENPNPNFSLKPITTLPTLADRISRMFTAANYVEIRRHKKRTWVHHVDAVSALTLSRDASLLYSASWDRTFKIWRVSDNNFKCLESVKAHDDAVNAIVVSNDGVVYTGSADRKIKAWKRDQIEKKHLLVGTMEKHKSAVNALALSEDGSILYSGACDRSILVWEKMGLVGALRGHTKAILCLVVMDDLVCSGSADNSVRIWRKGIDNNKAYNYSCVAVLQGHTKPVKCLAMAVDNDNNSNNGGGPEDTISGRRRDNCSSYMVYSGGLDCDIKVWRVSIPLF